MILKANVAMLRATATILSASPAILRYSCGIILASFTILFHHPHWLIGVVLPAKKTEITK
jgi:hypothetical protein